ncbi:EcoKI restriction-modification system protein HsdS [Streptococcus oralis]|jgi:restriction-modification enzyme type I S subunit|uniref:EcoKI restriction-modification system protein HsdS n=1 Tax=Streptococcus oralis TaxID=1303 RepID=A0A428FKF5_STROR|nr:restriction endonuclease subunit S [Streptococcus oralis]RSJ61730.1 EcoKI restriction-modification system protein HsdS [Streptococcus oralis]
MEEKILPILRFDNFNDYWRTSSLLSQVEVRRGLTYKPNDVRSKGARVLRSSNIVDDSFVIADDDVFVSKDVINIPRVSNGDILVTAANGSTKLVGKHAIIKNLPGDEIVVHGGFMLLFKTEQNYFVNAWMSSNEYKRVLQFVQGGNGAIGNLSSAILKSTKMSVPSFSEQSAIGSLFNTFDDLLARYKDNLTNYQSLKATMLAKMFPKAGQTVPEIRLDGFEGEWEIKKFKSISTKRGKSNSKGYDYPAYSVSNQSGLIPQSEQFEGSRLENLEKTSYKIVEPNEFAYNPARINVGSIAFNDLGEIVIVSSLYVIFLLDKSINNNYALLFIKSLEFNKEVRRNTEGSVREYLFYDNFANIRIPIPPSLDEQQAIGSYFSNLDNLINSHQEKISQLETLKKKLLKDMFI